MSEAQPLGDANKSWKDIIDGYNLPQSLLQTRNEQSIQQRTSRLWSRYLYPLLYTFREPAERPLELITSLKAASSTHLHTRLQASTAPHAMTQPPYSLSNFLVFQCTRKDTAHCLQEQSYQSHCLKLSVVRFGSIGEALLQVLFLPRK